MDALLTQIENYIELIPVVFVGLFAGLISYLQSEEENQNKKMKYIFKVIITSSFLTLIVFSILTATNLPYLACVGISAGVGYFGIDKAIEVAQKLISLKSNKGDGK